MTNKYVYTFGGGTADGDASMKYVLGGKGANLAEMSKIGVPVPAGLTISTDVCTYYYDNDKTYPPELEAQVKAAIAHVEKIMDKKFGDGDNPLLLSVRSGAPFSMPGMMDTVLNLGLNQETLAGLAKGGNERFAYDSYRRFVQMYGDVVLGMKPESKDEIDPFEEILETYKDKRNAKSDQELTVDDLEAVTGEFIAYIEKRTGSPFPTNPWDQLWGAVGAVFGSWNNDRAIRYRRLNKIDDSLGTAVNVQAMVFGNIGDDCATGVAFTRDPANGEKRFYGEYLINAQGEDVVAGIRTPQPVNVAGKKASDEVSLEEAMPVNYGELVDIYQKLEAHYRDMQDIEFTIERGKLWMLQTRNGKRTVFSALRIAVEMVDEGLITTTEAIKRVDAYELSKLFAPILDQKAKKAAEGEGRLLTTGLSASPGGACGKVVFHADEAEEWSKRGEKVMLVRLETSPEDIGGMAVAEGILTATGGMTSHAAVVARGMGVPCVAGAGAIKIDYKSRSFTSGTTVVKEGDYVAIDGFDGSVYAGEVAVEPSEIMQVLEGTIAADDSILAKNYTTFMGWIDEARTLGVRTNADTPKDAALARTFGAEGIGLCRTEHMFFEGARIEAVREMILADDEAGRRKALAKILPFQKEDFVGILGAMHDLPVTIRLLDPPLHEFLPHEDKQQAEMAKLMGIDVAAVKAKVEELSEFNPMLGHRGCRLGVTYPEITEMQATAIIEAACELTKQGVKVYPEIMVPLAGTVQEFVNQKTIIHRVAKEVIAKAGVEVEYKVGTMIEIPRAALTADLIGMEAEFFSFGTNDLTQMTFGYSRDDAGSFIREYLDKGILKNDPFQVLDQEGVGQLVRMGTEKGRSSNPKLKVGICGEHGGDPASVAFCNSVGMNYVSCSPYRVPVARLAAAQSALD